MYGVELLRVLSDMKHLPKHIIAGKIAQRSARWAMEEAVYKAKELEFLWREAVAIWAGTNHLEYSNTYCSKAPADASCVYNLDDDRQRCVFCGNTRDPVL